MTAPAFALGGALRARRAVLTGEIASARSAQREAAAAAAVRSATTMKQARRAFFAGAQASRLTGSDWVMAPTSIDQQLKSDLQRLRAFTRALVRDNPHARRFARLVATNVFGPHGMRYQSRVTDGKGQRLEAVNRPLERAFAKWSKPANCSADRKLSRAGLERLIGMTLPADGEVFLYKVRGAPNPFGFALQLVDAELVDHTYNVAELPGGGRVVMGVEVDRWGAEVAFYVWSAYPGEGTRRTRRRIPAADMVHLFVPEFAGQTRGFPWFNVSMRDLKMLDGFFEAAVTAARTGASGMMQITQSAEAIANGTVEAEDGDEIPLEMEPARGVLMPPGMRMEFVDAPYPNASIGDFAKPLLRACATGLGITYATLAGDLSDANYSSMREGKRGERDEWEVLQEHVIEHYELPVFADWCEMALLSPELALPYDAERYAAAADFQPRGWDYVDPTKDLDANERAIRLRLTTRRKLAAERGEDWYEIVDAIAEEEAYAKKKGVDLTLPAAAGAKSGEKPGEKPDTGSGETKPATGAKQKPAGDDAGDESPDDASEE